MDHARQVERVHAAGEAALIAAAVSATGFVRGTRAVRAEKRAKSSIKGSGADVTPAG
jgi:DNA gyrase subunit A